MGLRGMAGVFAALTTCAAGAAVQPATPFADGVVLQRERRVPVWGTATPGETVTVRFAGQEKTATADAKGAWRVDLDPMLASTESRTLTIGDVTIRDVLVGEVWLASGQSNMEESILCGHTRYRDGQGILMTALARRPNIRFVSLPQTKTKAPLLDRKIAWHDYSAKSFRDESIRVPICYRTRGLMSAVAFYYALTIHDATGVPVGIIDVSWGGSAIESWYADGGEMWNGMVAAFAPMAARGFIWYQGCANYTDGRAYCAKLRRLYDGWAKAFENPDQKLYIVELAPFGKYSWFEIQQAQAKFAADEPNASVIVTCDLGNEVDIHQNDKEPIGRRLALHALRDFHGFTDIVADSPTLESWSVVSNRFALTFKGANTWWWYNPHYEPAQGFEIAGEDEVFHPAKIVNRRTGGDIVPERVLLVQSDAVKEPRSLRYLYLKPWTGSLYSGDSGLPLGPFEIDRTTGKAGHRAVAKFGDALGDPVLAGFRPILQADIPAGNRFTGYALDKTAEAGAFTRVAYVVEGEDRKGRADWVIAAMDAFSRNPAELGVPTAKGKSFQSRVGHLVVRSNLLAVPEADGKGEGIVEFFSANYDRRGALAGAGGDDGRWDYNDAPAKPDELGYGCMQVHDLAAKGTVFAYNNFLGRSRGAGDFGLGTNPDPKGHPDWSFSHSADKWARRRITVLVK